MTSVSFRAEVARENSEANLDLFGGGSVLGLVIQDLLREFPLELLGGFELFAGDSEFALQQLDLPASKQQNPFNFVTRMKYDH